MTHHLNIWAVVISYWASCTAFLSYSFPFFLHRDLPDFCWSGELCALRTNFWEIGFLLKRALIRKLLGVNEQIMTDVFHCSSMLLWNRRPLKLGAAPLWHAIEDCASFRHREHQGHLWVPHDSLDRVQLRGNGFFIYYSLKTDICYLETEDRGILKKKKKSWLLF